MHILCKEYYLLLERYYLFFVLKCLYCVKSGIKNFKKCLWNFVLFVFNNKILTEKSADGNLSYPPNFADGNLS